MNRGGGSDSRTDETPRPDESFLQRFHRRKTEARLTPEPAGTDLEHASTDLDDERQQAVAVPVEEPRPALTDADMPPLESLTVDSDYSGFFSEKVSATLRRAALRKLFHSSEFNVTDGLDEYADDFTKFEPLGDIVTADMRHQLELEARKRAEALQQALDEQAETAAAEGHADADADTDVERAPAAADATDASSRVAHGPEPDPDRDGSRVIGADSTPDESPTRSENA